MIAEGERKHRGWLDVEGDSLLRWRTGSEVASMAWKVYAFGGTQGGDEKIFYFGSRDNSRAPQDEDARREYRNPE